MARISSLCARLRPSNQDASAGSVAEVARIVRQIRQRWPRVRIILRGDSGFCREELLAWCENHEVHYVFGFARNPLLRRKITTAIRQAKQEHRRTGKATRVFAEFRYRMRKSRSCRRRVVAKAEYLEKGENSRFVVTSLHAPAWPAQKLYEQLYCARGETLPSSPDRSPLDLARETRDWIADEDGPRRSVVREACRR
jgi:hypothetical protein